MQVNMISKQKKKENEVKIKAMKGIKMINIEKQMNSRERVETQV